MEKNIVLSLFDKIWEEHVKHLPIARRFERDHEPD